MTSEELHGIRQALGISQEELARRAGVKRNSVARQERGELEIRPALAILYRCLAHLGDEALPIIRAEMSEPKAKRSVKRRWRRRKKRE